MQMGCGGRESLVRSPEGKSPEGRGKLSVCLLIIFSIMHK